MWTTVIKQLEDHVSRHMHNSLWHEINDQVTHGVQCVIGNYLVDDTWGLTETSTRDIIGDQTYE